MNNYYRPDYEDCCLPNLCVVYAYSSDDSELEGLCFVRCESCVGYNFVFKEICYCITEKVYDEINDDYYFVAKPIS